MPAPKDSAHFVAVQTPELVDRLAEDPSLTPDEREAFRSLATLVEQVYHQHLHRRLVRLKNDYAPFDPDGDSPALDPISAQEKQQRLNHLLTDFAWLLDRAHFRHLSREEIEPVLENSSDWGICMEVDFSLFDYCAIFARGEAYETRALRSWKTLFRDTEIDVPIYRRLVLILKLRPSPRLGVGAGTDHVYLKLFKDIPRADVDMLMPGAKVRLRLLDRGRIGFGLFSGLGTLAFKMFNDLLVFFHDFVLKTDVFWGLAAGCAGYGYKSYYDYRTTQQRYHLNLTQSLYFQNLDSNGGVLTRLFDEAEEQETRTTLLAYFCLWRYAGPDGSTSEELEAAMELYLDRYAGRTLLCDAGEPAAKLVRLNLATVDGPRFRALPPPQALDALRALGELQAPVEGRPSRRSPSKALG